MNGAHAASGDLLISMDANGQHSPEEIPRLLDKLNEGYNMVVGAHTYDSHAGQHRAFASIILNHLALQK